MANAIFTEGLRQTRAAEFARVVDVLKAHAAELAAFDDMIGVRPG